MQQEVEDNNSIAFLKEQLADKDMHLRSAYQAQQAAKAKLHGRVSAHEVGALLDEFLHSSDVSASVMQQMRCKSDHLPAAYVPACLPVCLSVSLSVCLPARLSGCLSVCLSVSACFCLSVCLAVCSSCQKSFLRPL